MPYVSLEAIKDTLFEITQVGGDMNKYDDSSYATDIDSLLYNIATIIGQEKHPIRKRTKKTIIIIAEETIV